MVLSELTDEIKERKIKETAVVINCYNHKQFVKEAVYSVLNQTYQDFDVIFFDNNSTDFSYHEVMDILKEPNSKLLGSMQLIQTKFNYRIDEVLPIGIARWLAVQEALKKEYKYIAIVDADDFWTVDKLEKQIKVFKDNPEVKLVFSDCYYLHWEEVMEQVENYPAWIEEKKFNKVLPDTFHKKYKPKMKKPFWKLLTKYNFMPCPTLVFEADALREVIGKPMHYTAAEDYDWILKMTSKFKCAYIKEPLAYYRIHADQITQKTRARCTAEEIDVVKRAVDFKVLSRNQGMRVWIHLLWLYIKLLFKELAEAEDKIRSMK